MGRISGVLSSRVCVRAARGGSFWAVAAPGCDRPPLSGPRKLREALACGQERLRSQAEGAGLSPVPVDALVRASPAGGALSDLGHSRRGCRWMTPCLAVAPG